MQSSSLLMELKDLSASIESVKGCGESYWKAKFPIPDGADYGFIAYLYSDATAGISAKRHGSSSEEYFWFVQFEIEDYSSGHELQQDCLETLVLLLNNPTRIVQTKALLFMHFACEYWSDEEWKGARGRSGFRFSNFKFPKIAGNEKEYRSAPVHL